MKLSTNYLGLRLSSPLVVGASPFCDTVYQARNLQDAGVGALVLRSLFEEDCAPVPAQLNPDEPVEVAAYQHSVVGYAHYIAALKQDISIPVVASLNGTRTFAWAENAARLQLAGADAIELNFYRVVSDVNVDADQVELEMIEIVRAVTAAVRIPVCVKLSPYHTALAQLVVALELAGAAGVVLFNRFYQPDINISTLEVQPHLKLSVPEEVQLRLRWLAILSPKIRGTLIANGGFHASSDVIKALLTGASAVQVVSVLLRHGPMVLHTLHAGIESWMSEHGYADIAAFRGLLAVDRAKDASAFERANYHSTLQSWRRDRPY